MSVLGELLQWSRDLLSPPYCAHCYILLSERVPLCTECHMLIRPLVTLDLPITAYTTVPVRALGAYEDPLKRLLIAKQRRVIVAAEQAGMLLAEYLVDAMHKPDVLVPVPLHWRRAAWRGYNQAEVIAHMVGKRLQIPVVPLVKRCVHTAQQLSHRADERWNNVAAAFAWNHRYEKTDFSTKRIMIIDDIMTTGSTLKATARVLLTIQPSGLEAAVVARVL